MKKIKLGMVGGGRDAFIGAVHRSAARLDGFYELTAGALSSTPEKAKSSGRDIGLPEERNYISWEEMLKRELQQPEGKRIDAVAVVTPNHMHFPVARAFTEAGFNVICDKPLVHSSEQADLLIRLSEEKGTIFAVTYTYSGYPMVKQARKMVGNGTIGKVRKVIVEYNQDWLADRIEKQDASQAAWRTDPKQSGIAGTAGDIGSHAENLVSVITGLEIDSLCADVSTFIPGRRLDDNADMLLRFSSGAKGVLIASQIASGALNDLRIRIYGETGGLTWYQENPNYLHYAPIGAPEQVLKRGGKYLCEAALRAGRIPPGHPEGFIEAFANVYKSIALGITAKLEGRIPDEFESDFPTVTDGARGVRFIEKVIESGRSSQKWVSMKN